MDTPISSGAYIAMVGGYTSQLLRWTMQAPSAMNLLVVASFTVINLVGLVEVERISSFSRCSVSSCSAWPVVGLVNWQIALLPHLRHANTMSTTVDSLSIASG